MYLMKIKPKLILLFIIIKLVPLILILFLSLTGIEKLSEIIEEKAQSTLMNSMEVMKETTNLAIQDSTKALDKKSQESLEIITKNISFNVASFLYQRDNDVLFLANMNTLSHDVIQQFYNENKRDVIIPQEFKYDNKTNKWVIDKQEVTQQTVLKSRLKENEKYFTHHKDKKYPKISIPTYKEISFIDLQGTEKIKVSSINNKLQNISKKQNTYCKSETYFEEVNHLEKGEIYVSDVIGEYVKTNIVGSFTKDKANKAKIEFRPEEHGYAGRENPKGKKFEGIVRFITPRYENGTKIGYISMALDHKHIMEFTDYVVPTNESSLNYSDASSGNYAFMWDEKGRNISHPRDYFITGFDTQSGKRVKPWLSQDITDKLKKDGRNWEDFLKDYPTLENQSLSKKPTLSQIKDGKIPLDCRYLNFAPQCDGWMQITEDGGYGSFLIFWSNVWKLTTVATIPYYTGKYGKTKRGFGFVTMGANLDEFHSATTKTKESIQNIVDEKLNLINNDSHQKDKEISEFIRMLANELTVYTFFMIIIVVLIAIFIANYITSSLEKLIVGTKEFRENNFDYIIDIKSKDEIGILANSFNSMAKSIKLLFEIRETLTLDLTNSNKELKLSKDKLEELNKNLEKEIQREIENSRSKDLQLLNQSKMASLGDMIANIAHQWRQPLSIISTIASGMKLEKEYDLLSDEKFNKYCDSIVNKTEYLSQTIDTFRNFIKEEKEVKEILIQDSIEMALGIIDTTLKNNHIELIVDIHSVDKIKLYIVSGELEQVIINVINNAKDILMERFITNPFVKISLKKYNDTIFIIIEDNGGGINKDIIGKIFEPYFTTKHQSQGTGLGLHMSYKIVKESLKGNIYVENTGIGAKFFIEMPNK
jgi:nitrogen fixation/metabolism regulation signal transduction histidine kinase